MPKQLQGHLVLTPDHICEAIREYVNFHKLSPGRIQLVDLSGDGKTTARVTFVVGDEPAVGRDPRD